jgi:hypothetical protein
MEEERVKKDWRIKGMVICKSFEVQNSEELAPIAVGFEFEQQYSS